MLPPRGTLLLVLVLLIYLAVVCGREAFHEEGLPAVAVENNSKISILLGEGFAEPGVHQISDGMSLLSVINMTITPGVRFRPSVAIGGESPRDGETLDVVIEGAEIVEVKRGWMAAEQRLALGIALHPDRMTQADWEALPGIGSHLAEKIEQDRQENGEFGSIEALRRVSGIGAKSIANWKSFFEGG